MDDDDDGDSDDKGYRDDDAEQNKRDAEAHYECQSNAANKADTSSGRVCARRLLLDLCSPARARTFGWKGWPRWRGRAVVLMISGTQIKSINCTDRLLQHLSRLGKLVKKKKRMKQIKHPS